MKIKQIQSQLLNPPEGPVDVEFEHSMLTLFDILSQLTQTGLARSYEWQKRFCQQLRTCKMIFQNKIPHFYGKRYRGGTGGDLLVQIADAGVEILNDQPEIESKVLSSIAKHTEEIRAVNAALPETAAVPEPVDLQLAGAD